MQAMIDKHVKLHQTTRAKVQEEKIKALLLVINIIDRKQLLSI